MASRVPIVDVSVVDLTFRLEKFLKIVAWCDNEWGYSSRVINLTHSLTPILHYTHFLFFLFLSSSSKKERRNLQKEVLAALFITSEKPEELPARTAKPRPVRKSGVAGNLVQSHPLKSCRKARSSLKVPPEGTKQRVEFRVEKVHHVGPVDPAKYPLPKTRLTLEFLRVFVHFRSRTNMIPAVARICNALAYATHTFFLNHGFLHAHTPIITTSDCEGAGEMFQVTTLISDAEKPGIPQKDGKIDYSQDFFARQAFLTVSGQLQVETHACAIGSVYTFGPTFRAEHSHTSRHLAEFWMVEPEIAFADLKDDMNCAEAYVKFLCQWLPDNCIDDMEFMAKNFDKGSIDHLRMVASMPFERISYAEAIKLLEEAVKKDKKFENKVEWGIDLASEHERFSAEVLFKKLVIVHDYPRGIKAFYMRLNDDMKTVAADKPLRQEVNIHYNSNSGNDSGNNSTEESSSPTDFDLHESLEPILLNQASLILVCFKIISNSSIFHP
ncbi:unnamed protein product, partial [Vitis vinifera]